MDCYTKIAFISQTIMTIIAVISLLVVIRQLSVIKKQTKKDHERSRRETVLMLQRLWLEFCNDYKPRLIRRLLKEMNPETCKKCWEGETIKFSKECEEYVCQLLGIESEDLNRDNNDLIKIEDRHLLLFRTHLSNYLNLFEVIFTAWNDNVGDKEMIEREFGKNISKDNITFPLDNVVNACEHAFPSIKGFSNELKQRQIKESNIPSKKPL